MNLRFDMLHVHKTSDAKGVCFETELDLRVQPHHAVTRLIATLHAHLAGFGLAEQHENGGLRSPFCYCTIVRRTIDAARRGVALSTLLELLNEVRLGSQSVEMLHLCPEVAPCLRVACVHNSSHPEQALMPGSAGGGSSNWRIRGRVCIVRGLPGSGKSTLCEQLATEHSNQECVICGTDRYFTSADGLYHFDAARLPQAYAQSVLACLDAMQRGVPLVLIDNTHAQQWEYEPYLRLAQFYQYSCDVREVACCGQKQLRYFLARSVHLIPLHVAERMWNRWQPDEAAQLEMAWLPPDAPDFADDSGADEPAAAVASSSTTVPKPRTWGGGRGTRRVLFSAIFLDNSQKERLLRIFPRKHPLISANHVPLQWDPTPSALDILPFGASVRLRVTGQVVDACAQALTIEIMAAAHSLVVECDPAHLCVSMTRGTSAGYAAKLVAGEVKLGSVSEFFEGAVGVALELGSGGIWEPIVTPDEWERVRPFTQTPDLSPASSSFNSPAPSPSPIRPQQVANVEPSPLATVSSCSPFNPGRLAAGTTSEGNAQSCAPATSPDAASKRRIAAMKGGRRPP